MNIVRLITEFLATFFFFTVVLKYGEPISTAISLAAASYFCGGISQGHSNPGVSFMLFFNGDVSFEEFAEYILAHLSAAILAVYLYKYYQ